MGKDSERRGGGGGGVGVGGEGRRLHVGVWRGGGSSRTATACYRLGYWTERDREMGLENGWWWKWWKSTRHSVEVGTETSYRPMLKQQTDPCG
jgi:hypothetical protein